MTRVSSFLRGLLRSPSTVSFQDGSRIEFCNREALLYTENNGRQMEIPWYFKRGRLKARVLYSADVSTWDAPHAAENLSVAKKEEILRKVGEYSKERGIPLEILEKP